MSLRRSLAGYVIVESKLQLFRMKDVWDVTIRLCWIPLPNLAS